MKKLLLLALFAPLLFAIDIIQSPINFGKKRIDLTLEYIKAHYGITASTPCIVPRIIIVHHTARDDFRESLDLLLPEELLSHRGDIASSGALNVSAHFLVDRDGSIHQLMPLTYMARHAIGLNYNSIGIENVGGEADNDNLTDAQLKANVELVNYLASKFDTIKYLIGHYEYRCFEDTPLWLEVDDGYRTAKDDPNRRFMSDLRSKLANKLDLKGCDK